MKDLFKEFPATVLFVISLILMMPISIVLYFVLGADRSHQITVDYVVPTICCGFVLTLFELWLFRHDANKDDKDNDKNKEELKK